MKPLPLLLFFLWLLFPWSALGQEQSLEIALDDTLDSLDLGTLPGAFDQVLGEEDALRATLQKLIQGHPVWDVHTLLKHSSELAMSALTQSIRRAALLFVPAVLCSILERMRHSLTQARVGEMLEYACFLSLAGVMAADLSHHMKLSENSISRMSNAMQALFPMLLTLLSAVGGTAGTAFYQPALTAAGGTMVTLVRSFTLRLSLCHGAVTILDHLSDRLHLGALAALLRKTAVWTLGIAFTLFLSVTTLQGVSSAVADGISIRAAKYAVNNFVPVVGGMFADTMDTLVGSSLLVKNALGITGLVGLILLCAGPLLQTLCASWVYHLLSALLESVASQRITRCIQAFSHVLTLFFIIQLSVGAMFFLLIAQLLAVGNLIVMLR